MTNNIKIFEKEEFGQVRTLLIDGEPQFVGKDVAEILGYAKPLNAISMHVDEDDSLKQGLIDNMGRTQKTILINESGLYSLILSSKLPKAKEFKHWVTSEVLPSIRKHGLYAIDELIDNPDLGIKALMVLKEEREKNKKLTEENQIMKPKAEYFDDLVDKKLNINFRDTAKELHMRQNEFISILLDKQFVYRDAHGKLKPYAKYVNDGIFVIKEYSNKNHAGNQTLITPKGRETFRLMLVGQKRRK